ncbi:NAD-dependent protein deacetylase Sirt6 [Cimex lectularius]|uniref:protein acetyllysine N-acetyltransferase n=1 Tax=Cimex lectularius TaxID=79782 RepID=A0A8I6RIE1_CIMLE|nr:NAD-dependent protein deacetylase Sirt6 [Cimex lectularius]
MSCSYAEGLSPYENKGKLGLKEIFDTEDVVAEKVKELASWIENAKHVVVHTGAGISTSAGIPDFRGPNGVWTLEEKGEKPTLNISFDDAVPTKTHMALLKLFQEGKIHYIISQNIDGLHLKSGLSRKYLAELHGNMFVEECGTCKRQFVLKSATTSVGKKNLNRPCLSTKVNGRRCRGKTYDTILDWEHNLPEKDLEMADYHSCVADLSICLGTTLQIVPSGNLPLSCKKQNGKLVICNLQPTKHDKKADMIIHTYVDQIMEKLLDHFGLEIPEYKLSQDPTKSEDVIEWTVPTDELAKMKKIYKEKFPSIKRKNENGESSKKRRRSINAKKEEVDHIETESKYDKNLHGLEEEQDCKIKTEPKIESEVKEENEESLTDEKIVQNSRQDVELGIKLENDCEPKVQNVSDIFTRPSVSVN